MSERSERAAGVAGSAAGYPPPEPRQDHVSSATWPAWIATRRRASASLGAFGPHVRHRQLGVGQHERPAVGIDDLHAVDEHDLVRPSPVRSRRASPCPCVPTASAPLRARCAVRGCSATTARQRPVGRREQVEQVHERRGRVVRGQERRPDEAALLRCGEVDCRRCSRPPSGARPRASSTRSSRRPRSRCARPRGSPTPAARSARRGSTSRRGCTSASSACSVVSVVPEVVDDRRALPFGVEHEPEVRARTCARGRPSSSGGSRGRRRRRDRRPSSRTGSRRAPTRRSSAARSASRTTPRRTSSRARP